MTTYIYRLCLLVLALSISGCAYQMATDAWGFKNSLIATAFDPRISEKQATVDDDGVQTYADKHAMSKQFAEMLEEVLPGIVEQAVKAALASYGIGAISGAIGDWGNGELDVPEIMEEVVPDVD